MFIQLFQTNPAAAVALVLGFVVGITIHEAAHAYSALKLGDDTAYRDGRVTLNPAAHLDILGSLMLVMAGFGWGRPTPVMTSRLKGGIFGPVMVAFAGPLSNLLIVFICAGLYLVPTFQAGYLQVTIAAVAFVNTLLFIFNLIPIPPLDGSKILYPFLPRFMAPFVDFMNQYGPFILLALVVGSLLLNIPILGILLAPVFPILYVLGLGDALAVMYGG